MKKRNWSNFFPTHELRDLFKSAQDEEDPIAFIAGYVNTIITIEFTEFLNDKGLEGEPDQEDLANYPLDGLWVKDDKVIEVNLNLDEDYKKK